MRNLKVKVLALIIFLTASFPSMAFSHPGHGSYGVSEATHNYLYHAVFSWTGLLFLFLVAALILVIKKNSR